MKGENTMKNKRYKSKTYTISDELFHEFTTYCQENSINRSAIIRSLISKFLKENKKENSEK